MWHHLRNKHRVQLPISTEVYQNLQIDSQKELDSHFMNDILTKFANYENCEKDRAIQKKIK